MSLKLFYDLQQALREPLGLERIGFFISDSAYFSQFRQAVPDIESGAYTLLKEWEVAQRFEKQKPNMSYLTKLEERFGVPHLWNAVVVDRRFMYSRHFTYRINYHPEFSRDEMLSLTGAVFAEVEKLFDSVQPDFVVSFICTTVGEYAAYLIARERDIPFLNIRPTRIKNYITYGLSVWEPAEPIRELYLQYQQQRSESDTHAEAKTYIQSAQEQNALYEGVILPTQRPPQVRSLISSIGRVSSLPRRLLGVLKTMLQKEYHYRRIGPRYDRHVPGAVLPFWYLHVLNQLLVRKLNKELQAQYVSLAELPTLQYAFFPLHKEPEITLLVHSKPFMNQIEVIRNIALSLPIGMVLIVKEHPAAVGTRPLGYYQKLLDIPNVRLAHPATEPRKYLHHCRIVFNIAGSVGFEALLLKKPLITFGHTPYDLMPASMIRRITDINTLSENIVDLMQNYAYDEKALEDYVAATIKASVAVDWYTTLLERKAQFSTRKNVERSEEVEKLAHYTIETLQRLGRHV